MSVRATITSINGASSVKASISYVKPEADAHINNISKNQWFYENTLLSELTVLVITKPLEETINAVDDFNQHLTLPKTETPISVLDTFVKVITYDRYINDAFTLDDASLIDKDYYGNKGNIATLLEVMGISYNKPFSTDTYTVSDVVTVAAEYIRTFNDSIGLLDTGTSPLSSYTLNSQQLNTGNQSFRIYRGNDQVDDFGIDDLPAVTAGKQFNDNLSTLATAFSDTDTYSLDKNIQTDSIGCTDVFTYTGVFYYTRDYNDPLGIDELLSSNFSKVLQESSDIVSISDTINVQSVTGGVMNAIPLNRIKFN